MSVIEHEIDSYKIFHWNEDCTNQTHQTAQICCYKGAKCWAYLQFYKEGGGIPASVKGSADILHLRFYEYRFREVVETLRLEKPLYIRFNDVNS